MTRFPQLSDEAETLLRELSGAARTAPGGVPCQADSDAFTSEFAAERERAARLCAGCPIRVLCGRYAAAARERWGVWGGQDRTR
ncbi:WhiB family transcriptional regulator [Micrococcus luteus]|nr:WhiB family transcriptional regulator [Micrococcus luteus]